MASTHQIEESYFMSQEQRDAVIGRVTREKREADHNLALLQSEARRVSDKLQEIATLLQDNPVSIIFEDEPWAGAAGGWQRRIMNADLDLPTFKKLVTELRVASKKADEKKRELESLLR